VRRRAAGHQGGDHFDAVKMVLDPGEVERNDWGTIRLAFDSCNSAKATYNSIDFGVDTIDFTRLTSIILERAVDRYVECV
jgi:hypothetical protein